MRPSEPMTTSRMTTPCRCDDCAMGGYTGRTSFVFVGGLITPPIRTGAIASVTPSLSHGGGGGGGGTGGAASATSPPPAAPLSTPSGPPYAIRRGSAPGAKTNETLNEI